MKKFIILTATLFFATISFSQKLVKYQDFSKTNKAPQPKLLKAIKEKSTNLNITWQESFDTASTGTNGLPANWTYTPNSSNIDDQWQWNGTFSDGCIGRAWYGDIPINEEFYTDFHTVPDSNQAFYFDFMCSFYWFLENGSDSLDLYFSVDSTNTWTKIWSITDSADVVNSSVDWPFESWKWHTVRILLNDTLLGKDIAFKYILHGGTGNGMYLDNLMLVEMPNYDVEIMYGGIVNTYTTINDSTFVDGIYQLLPLGERRDFGFSKLVVKNQGLLSANNLVYYNKLTDASGNIVIESDTNSMLNGQSLVNFSNKDTFMYSGLNDFIVDIGTYNLYSNITFDNIDEDTTNNSFSLDIDYVDGYGGCTSIATSLARNTTITNQIGLHNYTSSADGDQIGIKFYVTCPSIISGACIRLGDVTDNTGFTLKLYEWDSASNAWVQIVFSDDIYTNATDADSCISVDFLTSKYLDPDIQYMLVVASHWTAGTSEISYATYNQYKDFKDEEESIYYAPASALNIGGTWYYIENIPCFTALIESSCTGSIEELSFKNKFNIFPNPANNTLNIEFENIRETNDNIQIYNTIGELVKEIAFNQSIDISNLEKGIYFIKIGNYSNKFVKL